MSHGLSSIQKCGGGTNVGSYPASPSRLRLSASAGACVTFVRGRRAFWVRGAARRFGLVPSAGPAVGAATWLAAFLPPRACLRGVLPAPARTPRVRRPAGRLRRLVPSAGVSLAAAMFGASALSADPPSAVVVLLCGVRALSWVCAGATSNLSAACVAARFSAKEVPVASAASASPMAAAAWRPRPRRRPRRRRRRLAGRGSFGVAAARSAGAASARGASPLPVATACAAGSAGVTPPKRICGTSDLQPRLGREPRSRTDAASALRSAPPGCGWRSGARAGPARRASG